MEKNKAHQTSQGFSRIRTRILALTLAILTALTALPSQTAYASSVGGNVSGGGTGGMGATTDAKAWSSNDQGYRFYLVDENFNRVTDVYDFVFSTPSNIGEQNYTTRFDGVNTPTSHDTNNTMPISELARLTQQKVTLIPKPVLNNKGQGVAFKEWFLKNSTGSGGILNSGSSGSNKGHTGSSSGSHTGGSHAGGSSSGSNNSSAKVPDSIRRVYTSVFRYRLGNGPSISELSDDEREEVKKFKKKALMMAQNLYDSVSMYVGNGMTPDDARAYAALTIRSLYKEDYGVKVAEYLADYVYGAVSIIKKPQTDKDLLTQYIPLAKPDTEYTDTSTEGCPALIFLTDRNGIQVAGYEHAYEAMSKGNYNLVIEPITWLCVNTGGSNYESYKTYGSYYNIARKWVSKGGKDSGSFYNSYMGSLGNNCLVVSRESKSMDGSKEIKPITSAVHRKISETVSLIEAGYGLSMHMYSSDFDPSSTHTYDTILGTLPGPAPDPSDLPQDSPDKGGNTITIIKNYVTETNGTEQTDGNYTRVKNPHTIEIEDEPNYKVVEWNTSTKEAPSIPDGSKTPWSDVIKTSTKTKTGTSSTTVELSNKEKVMYIKLKKADGISENPEVSGDWVLNESELTTAVSSKQATIFLHKI